MLEKVLAWLVKWINRPRETTFETITEGETVKDVWMNIMVNRFTSDGETTLSTIAVDGKFECFGLEDEYRDVKVYGETRIPAGRYIVGVRKYGGFHEKYKKHSRYGKFHRGMLEIMAVPGFTDVLVHVGNREDDTAACLLTGLGAFSKSGQMAIHNSADAYEAFYKKVIEAAENGTLSISYVDSDRS